MEKKMILKKSVLTLLFSMICAMAYAQFEDPEIRKVEPLKEQLFNNDLLILTGAGRDCTIQPLSTVSPPLSCVPVCRLCSEIPHKPSVT
jgi:hypothetical protein